MSSGAVTSRKYNGYLGHFCPRHSQKSSRLFIFPTAQCFVFNSYMCSEYLISLINKVKYLQQNVVSVGLM